MAAPTFVQSQTSFTSDGTSHSVTLPSGITTGNLLLAMIAVDGVSTTTIDTGASGSNWTISAQAANSTIVSGYFVYKIAEGSDVLTLTTSATERISAVVFEFSGASGTVDGTSANGSGTNSDPASHTPAGGSKDYMWVAYRGGDATVQATVSPSGYSTLVSISGGSGAGTTSGAAYKAATASSENPGTFTSSSEQWVCWTIAVYPTASITTTLPSPANISIVGNVPTTTTTAHITTTLPAPINVAISGNAPTTSVGVSVETILPAPINVAITGNAPTAAVTAHISTTLPAPIDVTLVGNTITTVASAHVTTTLSAPINLSIDGYPPTTTVVSAGSSVSELPAPVSIGIVSYQVETVVSTSSTSHAGGGGGRSERRRHLPGKWEDTKVTRKRKRKRKKKLIVTKEDKPIPATVIELVESEELNKNRLEILKPEYLHKKYVAPPLPPEPKLSLRIYDIFNLPSIFGLPAPFAPIMGGLEPDPYVDLPEDVIKLLETRKMLSDIDPEFASYSDDDIMAIHFAIYDEELGV